MKRINVLIFGIMLVLSSGMYCFASGRHYPESSHHEHDHEMDEGKLIPSGEVKDGVRVIDVKTFRYGFNPDPIVVKKGERVRLRLTSADVPHGLTISEFGIHSVATANKVNTVEFTPDKQGDFHMHCSVYCGPGHSKMHGTLRVIK